MRTLSTTPTRLFAPLFTGLLASCSLLFQSSDGQDAGTEVLSLTPSFTLLPIPCGVTKITPTNVSVFLEEGAPSVALYRWVLLDPDGIEIHSSLGPPGDLLERSARVLGGTIEAPEFNLTLYRGKHLGLFTRTKGADTPSLLQHISLNAGTYELEAVVEIPTATKSITARLRDADPYADYGNTSYQCVEDDTCGKLQYIRTLITTNGSLAGTDMSSMLQFVFSGLDSYIVDGVRLRASPSGEDLIPNGSFEDNIGPWSVGNGQSATMETQTIPDNIAKYGVYTLELTAIDSEETEGPVLSKSIEHYRCN